MACNTPARGNNTKFWISALRRSIAEVGRSGELSQNSKVKIKKKETLERETLQHQTSVLSVFFIASAKYDRIFFSLFDQLIRSGTSIGANVIEAKAGSSTKDFKNYYKIALKSANETKYWLCLIRDTVLVDERDKLNELVNEADELSKIIASIIINLD